MICLSSENGSPKKALLESQNQFLCITLLSPVSCFKLNVFPEFSFISCEICFDEISSMTAKFASWLSAPAIIRAFLTPFGRLIVKTPPTLSETKFDEYKISDVILSVPITKI